MSGWIRVDERLPQLRKYVLVQKTSGVIEICRLTYAYRSDKLVWMRANAGGNVKFDSVIVWQPLPEKYEEKTDESNKSD